MAVIWKAVIFTLEGTVGFIANLLVIIVMIKHTKIMGTNSSKFILNQSIIDAFTSLMIIFSHTNLVKHMDVQDSYTDNNVWDEIRCKTWRLDITVWSFVAASTFNLVILTLERYICIVHPFWHKKHIRSTVTKIAIAVPWILGPAFQLACFTHMADVRLGKCKLPLWSTPWAAQTVGLVSVIVEFFIPLLAMMFCYGMILYTLHKRWQQMKYTVQSSAVNTVSECISDSGTNDEDADKKSNENSGTNIETSQQPTEKPTNSKKRRQELKTFDARKEKHEKSERKVIKMLISVCVAFFLCFIMNQMLSFLSNSGIVNLMYGHPLYSVSVMIAFVNCMINPFIYVIQYDNFRVLLFQTLRCN